MKFIDCNFDRWQEATADNDDAVVAVPRPEPFSLLGVGQWKAVRASWPAEVPVGLVVDNDVDIETVADDLPRFALVALRFPKWVDGRAYSQARLLRSRLRFKGELRATGDVVADMLPLLARTGFDAVVLRADQSVATAKRALGFFPQGHYQGDLIEPQPRFARSAEASPVR